MTKADFIVIGAGPSGLLLSRLLTEKYPEKTIILVNKSGPPPYFPFKIYFLNVLAVVFSWFYPKFNYTQQNQKRQFINCSYTGGNSNINAGVAVLPTEEDVEKCLDNSWVPHLRSFLTSKWFTRISSSTPPSEALERLSKDLNKLPLIHGGQIRMFAEEKFSYFRKRLHPDSFVENEKMIKLVVGEATQLIFSESDKSHVIGVKIQQKSGIVEYFARETFLCCGAIESPKLLIASGYGPKQQIERPERVESSLIINEHVGTNLMDHFVKRFEVRVPQKYNFNNFYPCIMGYKFRYKDICFGFGKLKPTGMNLFSFATAKCHGPGRLKFMKELGCLEPVLVPDEKDLNIFWDSFFELKKILEENYEIEFKSQVTRDSNFSPNWHYCGTLSMGKCVDIEGNIKGLKNVRCADLSILREITPMNTQMMSYLIAFAIVERL